LLPAHNEQPWEKFRTGFGNHETVDENCQGSARVPPKVIQGTSADRRDGAVSGVLSETLVFKRGSAQSSAIESLPAEWAAGMELRCSGKTEIL
jgi:hypothetical protein